MREARIQLTKAGIYDPKIFWKKWDVKKTQVILNVQWIN